MRSDSYRFTSVRGWGNIAAIIIPWPVLIVCIGCFILPTWKACLKQSLQSPSNSPNLCQRTLVQKKTSILSVCSPLYVMLPVGVVFIHQMTCVQQSTKLCLLCNYWMDFHEAPLVLFCSSDSYLSVVFLSIVSIYLNMIEKGYTTLSRDIALLISGCTVHIYTS